MMIFLADGRLGNQIFQYVFLKTIQKNNERIVVSGMEDLKKVFEIDNIINFNKKNRWIRAFLFRVCKPILYFLSDKRIISSISVNREKILDKYTRETTSFTEQKGFFNFIIFVKLGFFQSEEFFDTSVINNLKIKNKYLGQADNFLFSCKNKYKVFIHIRRGDYRDYKIFGKNTLLPMDYFHNQIKWFMKNKRKVCFIVLSDDSHFIKNEFNYIADKLISFDNHFGTDFAIMTKCNGAILSPSSFGWWGSYLMKNRDIVFAPKHWLGFNSNISFHKKPLANCVKEVEV